MFDPRSWFRSPSDSQRDELSRSVQMAFALARRTGRPVALALAPQSRRCLHPRLAPGTRIGKPTGVPAPKGMLDPRWAERPTALMVSPWQTATEGMWFLTDRKGALCMHLTAQGGLRFLRYQREQRSWLEV